MPIYEYRCGQCGKISEFIQKISDAPITQCPNCHAEQMTKVISSTRFKLSGSGWYATDYANTDKKSAQTNASNTATEKSTEKKD